MIGRRTPLVFSIFHSSLIVIVDAVQSQVLQNSTLRAKKLLKFFSLNMCYLMWDRPFNVSVYDCISSVRTRPFKFLFIYCLLVANITRCVAWRRVGKLIGRAEASSVNSFLLILYPFRKILYPKITSNFIEDTINDSFTADVLWILETWIPN